MEYTWTATSNTHVSLLAEIGSRTKRRYADLNMDVSCCRNACGKKKILRKIAKTEM